jgi:antitoxin (DNA-binding transcriptional repressor) of toxin-antitoxin stability system
VITVHGKPAARILPLDAEQPRPALRRFGLDKGKFTVPDDFDFMSEEELAEWHDTPLVNGRRKPVFGIDEGKFTLPDDFDIMSEEELAEWYDASLDE